MNEFIPNIQKRDPLLSKGLKQGGKYSVDLISTASKTYNFIIYTPQGVFDTTKYNLINEADNNTLTLSTPHVLTDGASTKVLVLAYNPTPDEGGNAKVLTNKDELTTKTRYVVIPENTIERVIIKGRRNFLPNQNPRRGTI